MENLRRQKMMIVAVKKITKKIILLKMRI